MEQKFFEERAALEAKYQKLYQPLYSKRYEIVNGVQEVDGVVNGDVTDKEVKEKGVPGFWLTAMKNNVIVADEIVERDEEALKYLNDIKWCRIDVPKGFKLEFFFDPNPYFKNSVLTKTYHIIDDDELVMEEANGMEVEWYPGKCLTLKLLKKKPRKGSKNAKPVIKTEKCAKLEDQMDQDYTVGTTIRNKIIPHAVSWFTGEAEGDDCDEIDSEDYDGEEEEEDEEDEDEDDDSEVKDRKKIISVNGRGVGSSISNKAGGGQLSEHAPDCRRQDRMRVM
ncbi:hypothetical protein QYF36_008761 [Acer negundo]|nr:hypothetical protein QYF36_008761 [Acer negundo]